jgi:hypothetical protein
MKVDEINGWKETEIRGNPWEDARIKLINTLALYIPEEIFDNISNLIDDFEDAVYESGNDNGYGDGHDAGYDDGYEDGYEDGESHASHA